MNAKLANIEKYWFKTIKNTNGFYLKSITILELKK